MGRDLVPQVHEQAARRAERHEQPDLGRERARSKSPTSAGAAADAAEREETNWTVSVPSRHQEIVPSDLDLHAPGDLDVRQHRQGRRTGAR